MPQQLKILPETKKYVDDNDHTKGYFINAILDPDGEFDFQFETQELDPVTKTMKTVTKTKNDFTETAQYFIPFVKSELPDLTQQKILSRAWWNHYRSLQKLMVDQQTETQPETITDLDILPENLL